MELITAIVSLVAVAAPLAMLGGWLSASAHRGLGTVVPRSGEGWWRATMPWPQGVQEENDPGWNLHSARPEDTESSGSSSTPDDADLDVPMIRLHPRIRAR